MNYDIYQYSPLECIDQGREPQCPQWGLGHFDLGAYFIHVDLLLVLLLLLQELLVLLLNDQLSQGALRQWCRLGSIQGSVTG